MTLVGVISISLGSAAVALSAGMATTASASSVSKPKSALMVYEAVNANLGPILVTTKGFTLYRYALDKANKVVCTGSCAIAWPPLVLPAGVTKPTGGKGVTALGTIKDPNGKLQVTFKGHPLYTYSGDRKPGSIKGGTVADFSVIQPAVQTLTS